MNEKSIKTYVNIYLRKNVLIYMNLDIYYEERAWNNVRSCY